MKKTILILLFLIASTCLIGCNNSDVGSVVPDEFPISEITTTKSVIDMEVGAFAALPIEYDGTGDYTDLDVELDNNELVTIEEGLITAKKVGVCNVKVSAKKIPDIYATFQIRINESGFKKYKILFGLPTNGLPLGSTVDLTIKNLDMIGAESLDDIAFEITDENIISLSSDYKLKALKKGTCIIKAYQKSCPSNTGELRLYVGNQSDETTRSGEPDNTPLILSFKDGNYVIDAAKDEDLIIEGAKRYQRYRFKSSDEHILLVSDEGKFMGVSDGIAEVSVTSKDSRSNITNNTITVKVTGSRFRTSYAEDFVKMALSQEGVTERDHDNHNRFTEWNHCYDAWCATFVSWCANQSGVPLEIVPRSISVQVFTTLFENMGRFSLKEDYKPVRGDLIIFASAGASHIGIVTGSDANKVYTIEGNTADMVAQRQYVLNYKEITGYGRPNWDFGKPEN